MPSDGHICRTSPPMFLLPGVRSLPVAIFPAALIRYSLVMSPLCAGREWTTIGQARSVASPRQPVGALAHGSPPSGSARQPPRLRDRGVSVQRMEPDGACPAGCARAWPVVVARG
ncbi:hypothetical protein SBRY_11078 [Actinacidiphila bryophytorum]|uniref:Uncharacterized protein n=1 Tax=Actinacidiphila bryophytorum TaxID=1436133 RepID=A0A9W4ECT3_9ACTN|nr:hypothetical protein SBRY_11078 [Actinacidiphila bryophytorum]